MEGLKNNNMKAIISTTYDDKYLFFLPITTWLWGKLGVDVICFVPYQEFGTGDNYHSSRKGWYKSVLINSTLIDLGINLKWEVFYCPEHKQATYAQCSRLYAAALDIPEDEILVTSDIDMLMFRLPEMLSNGFSIFGADLVPEKQYPMCYISATRQDWRLAFDTTGKTPQQCLDELLGDIDSISMKSDYWAKDQEVCYNMIFKYGNYSLINRTNGQNQFATNRLDRDDSYILDRLSIDVYDYHANRPGYKESNFDKILKIISWYYPQENLDWLVEYRNSYVNLL